MPLERLSLLSLRSNGPGQEKPYYLVSKIICKFLYLFFPRDIHNASCIVVKAVAQVYKKRSSGCAVFGEVRGDYETAMLRTRYRAPNERSREIGFRWS